MKKIFLLCLVAMFALSCGINKQARQIKALENCKYEITSADSLIVAGTDVSKLINSRNIDISRVPGLAIAFLRKDIPFAGRLNLQIKNPSSDLAAINQFEYKVLIKDQEIATGFVDQRVSIAPGGTTTVPMRVNANIYQFLSNGKTMKEIVDFIQGGNSAGTEKKGVVTLKIKPTIDFAGKLIKYPGYITIDKELSSKILF